MNEAGIRILLYDNNVMMQTLSEYLSSADEVRLEETATIDMQIARILPEKTAKRLCVVAIGEVENRVVLAMANPLDVVAQDTVRLHFKREIKVALSSKQQILAAIEAVYHGSDLEEHYLRSLEDGGVGTEEEDSTLEDRLETDISRELAAASGPVVQLVDVLLRKAVNKRASDIHIEPQERSMIIRMRIDGMLQKIPPPARKMRAAIVSRIKVLSKMNIAEHRLPQDGRFKIRVGSRKIDIRVSTAPTKYGEKVVMRILDPSVVSHDLDQLGFEPDLLEELKTVLSQSHGIIIVTGPTGSGKSTTLYSALNYLKDPTKNITTVEDPIEYTCREINQIQIKPKIGLDFATCLRAILRQDPDIIFIGEIRDRETTEIAINASLTGHLVLSTFHTNDAPSAISRLVHMGVEPYLLASTLDLVIAQRLVRKICHRCKEPVILSEQVLRRLKIDPEQNKNTVFYRGKGCNSCGGTGYSGRIPIFEFLFIDDAIREKLIDAAGESEVRAMARDKGYGGLLESGAGRILQGLTTAEEVLSATFTESTRVREQQNVLSAQTD